MLDWWPIAAFALMCAVAWGDLRREVGSNRKSNDERHGENVTRLMRIEDKLDRVNGTVNQHEGRLDSLERDR